MVKSKKSYLYILTIIAFLFASIALLVGCDSSNTGGGLSIKLH